MKRFLPALLSLTLFLALALPARADVLWEPYGNQFFYSHYRSLDYIGRDYYANGSDGFITLWDAPDGSTVIRQYENGQKLWAGYQYKDWVLMAEWLEDLPEDASWAEREISGWTPLSDLKVVYDHISFEGDYASEIRKYHGEIANYDGDLSSINFYEYPGAPEVKLSCNWRDTYLQQLERDGDSIASQLNECAEGQYTDEEGRSWFYIPRMREIDEAWFCLDDPAGTDFPLREIPDLHLIPAQTPVLPTVSYTPYILVTGVVLVTAALLFWFYGRKRKDAA